MAGIWTPSGINNNRVALAHSNMMWNKIVSFQRRAYGFWYFIQGRDDFQGSYDEATGLLKFDFTEEITGYKMEMSFRGQSVPTRKVGYGSPEVQLVGTNYISNMFGGFQFELCKYVQDLDIPGTEYDQLKGNEQKTESLISAYADAMGEGMDTDIANDVHGNTTQSQTSVLGLPFLISTTSSYPFDRTDSAHAKLKSQVDDASSAALTKHMLGVNHKKCRDAGARSLVGLANIENYQDIEDLVQDRIQPVEVKKVDDFGGMFARYGQVPYAMDNRSAANTVYHICPEDWKVMKNNRMLNSDGIVRNPMTNDSYMMKAILYLGIGCQRPQAQGSIINLA